MHRMLLRQLNRFFGPADSVPAHLRNFINAVDEAYETSEAEQKHLAHSYDQAARDLQDRNRLLAQRNKELDALKQCAVDCIIIADFEGRIVDANPAAQATLGRSLHELRGHVIYEAIISEHHRESHSQLLSRHLTGHETGVSRIETRCVRPGSGEFPVEMAITVVRGEGPSQIIVCFRDISLRKQGGASATSAAPAPSQASGPPPDLIVRLTEMLQEPLANMIQSVEQLEETPLTGPQRHHVETLHSASETVVRLLTRMLEHTTSGASSSDEPPALRVPHVEKEFDLGRIIEAMVDTLAPEAARKGLEFNYSVNPDVPIAVIGDPQRFDQVLHNLVGNAIKFTDRGEVMVHVTSNENTDSEVTIRCAVKDTGRGIPQDQLERLYKQLSDPNSPWNQSGRGLAVCQQLITAMGGTLGMESQPGQGSTFWFTVKMRKQHVIADPHDEDRPMISGTEGLRVLVVDDNPNNLTVMKEQLTGMKMSVETAPSGSDALKILLDGVVTNKSFDIAVVDYEMPGMDGIELGRTVRAIPSLRHLPMVLLRPATAMVNDMMMRDGGFRICVAKPLRPAQLRDAIDSAMSGPLPGSSVTPYDQEQDPRLQKEQAPPPPGPMKLEVVIEKCMGDLSYLERILYKFQDQSDETFKRIIQCLNARDKDGSLQLLSALAGAAEYLGADDLRDHAVHVGEAVKVGAFNDGLKAMGALKEELFRCIEYIPELLHQVASRKEAA
ncbi:MAG TPA: ATP-binding protein [Tepidisphaeraceae bacterium]|jgi:PAS domain S-box-containing protein|nr:ATP-binding protein [Tepidisphaeraceae bacterium]